MVTSFQPILHTQGDREPDWFLLDENGESVLSLALWSEHFDLASRILVAASRQYQKTLGPTDTSANAVLAQFTGGPGATSLLHRAVEHNQLEAVRFLIRHRDDVDHSFCTYRSPHSPKVEDDVLWANENSAVNHSFRDAIICPLWTALTWNRLNIADLLVCHGADVNRWHNFLGTAIQVSLLHRCIDQQYDIAAAFLIQ
ncbi:hypothetical protein P879_10254, partial [Paragonimus westermani]